MRTLLDHYKSTRYKKMWDGGIAEEEMLPGWGSVPGTTSTTGTEAVVPDAGKKGGKGAGLSAGLGMAAGMGSGIIDSTVKKDPITGRTPIGATVGKGALQGAAAGSAFGPWGAVVGAGAGAILGGVQGKMEKDEALKQYAMQKIQKGQTERDQSSALLATNPEMIHGSGTANFFGAYGGYMNPNNVPCFDCGGKMAYGGGIGDPPPKKKVTPMPVAQPIYPADTYQNQAEVDAANAQARSLAIRQSGEGNWVANNSYVARQPGDPRVKFTGDVGRTTVPRATTLPRDVTVDKVLRTMDGYGYNDPQSGNFMMVDPGAIYGKYGAFADMPAELAKVEARRKAAGTGVTKLASGGGIHIKPENRGKFNATKARTGKSTEELTHSSNPVTRKRAIFAQNAKKWKHEEGGMIEMAEGGKIGSMLSIRDYLASKGENSSYKARKQLAIGMGIKNYRGTAAQNIRLLKAAKSGTLRTQGAGTAPTPVTGTTPLKSKPTTGKKASKPSTTKTTVASPTIDANGYVDLEKAGVDPLSRKGIEMAQELAKKYPGARFVCNAKGCSQIASNAAAVYGQKFNRGDAWDLGNLNTPAMIMDNYKEELNKPRHGALPDPKDFKTNAKKLDKIARGIVGLNRKNNNHGALASKALAAGVPRNVARKLAVDSEDYGNNELYPGTRGYEHVGYMLDKGKMLHGTGAGPGHPGFYVIDSTYNGINLGGYGDYDPVEVITPGKTKSKGNARLMPLNQNIPNLNTWSGQRLNVLQREVPKKAYGGRLKPGLFIGEMEVGGGSGVAMAKGGLVNAYYAYGGNTSNTKKKKADANWFDSGNPEGLAPMDNGGDVKEPALAGMPMKGGYAKQLSSTNTEMVGNTHAQGGITVPQLGVELEDNETTNGNYVYSDKLGFADIHRKIARAKGKIEKKPSTQERVNSMRRLEAREKMLAEMQEYVKQQNGQV